MPTERILIVIALAVLVLAAVLLTRRRNTRSLQSLKAEGPNWDALGHAPDGRRTLVAFSTPSCAACHTAQAPAIDVARKHLGDHALRVIKIDAARQPDAARAFGIMTVPSTVVIDSNGERVIARNQGFAPTSRLLDQLQRA